MSKKNQISFIKPTEPSFLKQFKKRAGYKEGPTLADKKRELPVDDGNQEDKSDERPQIISLKPGDLTADEVAALTADDKSILPDELNLNHKLDAPTSQSEFASTTSKEETTAEGKILFRKPTKRPAADEQEKNTTKNSSLSETKKPKPESVMEKVSNKSLLSFNQGDDED